MDDAADVRGHHICISSVAFFFPRLFFSFYQTRVGGVRGDGKERWRRREREREGEEVEDRRLTGVWRLGFFFPDSNYGDTRTETKDQPLQFLCLCQFLIVLIPLPQRDECGLAYIFLGVS